MNIIASLRRRCTGYLNELKIAQRRPCSRSETTESQTRFAQVTIALVISVNVPETSDTPGFGVLRGCGVMLLKLGTEKCKPEVLVALVTKSSNGSPLYGVDGWSQVK